MHLVGASVAVLLLGLPATAQTITDGDTIRHNGVIYRLWGIDAPESKQNCADGWPAARLATTRLQALIAGRNVICEEKDRASGEDIGAIMVREGMAWAFVRYSRDYVDEEAKAKADQLGVHAHGCQPAWEWRAQQPAKAGQ